MQFVSHICSFFRPELPTLTKLKPDLNPALDVQQPRARDVFFFFLYQSDIYRIVKLLISPPWVTIFQDLSQWETSLSCSVCKPGAIPQTIDFHYCRHSINARFQLSDWPLSPECHNYAAYAQAQIDRQLDRFHYILPAIHAMTWGYFNNLLGVHSQLAPQVDPSKHKSFSRPLMELFTSSLGFILLTNVLLNK